MKKIHARQLTLMLCAKKNSYKEFDNKKKFLRLENSPPPPPPTITFLMVRPLKRYLLKIVILALYLYFTIRYFTYQVQQNQQECVFTFLYQSIAKLKEEIQQVFVVRPLVFVSNCCLLVFLKIFVFVF